MKNKNLFIVLLIIICEVSIISCKKEKSTDIKYTIGQNYGGGIVFYVDGTGQHGLISAASNQSASAQWGRVMVTPATGTAVGLGQANTTAIINTQGAGNYAANICDELVLNGYSDWFLPSKDELYLLYKASGMVGGFSDNLYYWSSSETSNSGAWLQFFSGGQNYGDYKGNTNSVRAVRAF